MSDAHRHNFVNRPKESMIYPEADRIKKCVAVIAIVSLAIQETIGTVGPIDQNYDVCRHPDCQRTTVSLLSHGNFSVRPCDDFYEYSCGHFLSSSALRPNSISYGYINMLEEYVRRQMKDILSQPVAESDGMLEIQAKNVYSTCMDTGTADRRGAALLEGIINSAGGWPMIQTVSQFESANMTWIDVHRYFHRLTGAGSLINVRVYGDYFTKNIPKIHLDQPTSVFGKHGAIKEQAKHIYAKFIKDLALDLATSTQSPISDEMLQEDVLGVMIFRDNLVNIMSWNNERRNEQRKNNRYTFHSWQTFTDANATANEFDNIDWMQLVSDILENNILLDSWKKIIVSEPNYLIELLEVLHHTPLRTILNHLFLHFVENNMKYTSTKMRTMVKVLNEQITGVSRTPQRWRTCLVEHPMQHVVGRMYAKTILREDIYQLVSLLCENIRLTILDQVSNAPWMDMIAKERAMLKVRKMKLIIGHPKFYDDQLQMESYYENQAVGHDNLLNALGYAQNEFRMQVMTLLDRTLRDENNGYPTDVNAFYHFSRNSLQINAAILQWPFFTPNLPDVVIYATLGTIIGHEMAHAFDNIGRYFDENGATLDWWGDRSFMVYGSKIDCLIKQYNRYTARTPHRLVNIDGRKTAGENIADAIGMRAGLDAFKNITRRQPFGRVSKLPGLTQYGDMEMFFFAAASVRCEKINPFTIRNHVQTNENSLPRFRVNGPLSNSPEFSEAYKCPRKTPMNPANKCKIWKQQ